MALLVARPSRGSWLFFGLVTLAALSARGYGNYERSVVRRDAPVAETAQRLAGCVFGDDATWLLAPDDAAEWRPRFAAWLRAEAAVASAAQGGWPARCAPLAAVLTERLQRTPGGADARRLSEQVQSALREAGRDRLELIARLDSDDADALPQLLVELFGQVRGLSQGTREGWRPTPATFARDAHLAQPELPRLASLPASVERPTLASGSSLVFFSSTDGMAHQLELAGGAMRDTVFGPALPFGDGARDGVLRAESDGGGAWAVLGDAPRLFPMPARFAIEAEPARFAWDAAVSGAWFALATLDAGTGRVQVTPRDGPTRWLAPAAVGPEESLLAALVAPGASPDAWVVTTLRSEVTSLGVEQGVLEQYDARVEAAPPPDPRRAPPPSEPPRLALSEARRVARAVPVPTFGARVSTCAWGSLRYVALVGDRDMTVLRVRGASVDQAHAAVTWPRGREVVFTCDSDRALVGAAPAIARGGHVAFSFGEGPRRAPPAEPLALEPPSMGPAAALLGVVMVRGGYLALVSNQATLRAYRYTPRAQGGRWEAAGLVALTSPPSKPTRTFARVAVSARGDAVTMLLEGTWSPRPVRAAPDPNAPPREEAVPAYPYTTVVVSGDGGRTFWSP